MGESKLLLALFCNKILTKSEQGVVVVVISWRSGCVTLTVTLQLYRGGECAQDVDVDILTRHTVDILLMINGGHFKRLYCPKICC